ncbi:MAG: biotin--[acetyl-CoA-carboxylase] ligase [Pseudomonadota bacterium]
MTDAPPLAAGVVSLDEVDSTNDEARRRAEDGAEAPLWIVAARQTKGRGRQGRVWEEADGNLYATLLLRPSAPSAEAALLSFAASLAVAALFESAGAAASLKWPNDALIGGRKAAGILLEGSGSGDRLDWLAVGIGVNLVAHPPGGADAAHPPTDLLAETGVRLDPAEALARLASAFEGWAATLARKGFAPLREAWLARAARLGERIEARTPSERLSGVFEDVDAAGALVLRTPTGRRAVHAADVYFR